jgi:hypothetical protein
MFSEHEKTTLRPLACAWAEQQEAEVLKFGAQLNETQVDLAKRAGIREIDRVRALAVPSMPLPQEEPLRSAAERINLLSRTCRGIAIGYGIMLRADSWADQELLAHQLVHVAQYEREGGVAPFLTKYFEERLSGFGTAGSLELEARERARQLAGGTSSSPAT